MNEHITCSIIIPSYRSAPTIGACLTALLEQDTTHTYEIIVVDSSPADDATPEIVRRDFPQVGLLHLPQKTDPAQARNLGAQQASGEVFAFIDSDCIAAPDWLERLTSTLEEGYDAVGGAIANGNGDTIASWAGYMCEFREFLPTLASGDVENLTLGNVAYRRERFEEAGGFPVGCFPQEDQVFHKTLRELGARIRFDARIIVSHMHRRSRLAFLKHQRRIGQANARVLRQLQLPGTFIVQHPLLALLALPALISLRFFRTVTACVHVEQGIVLRQLSLLWLCWMGICLWGLGLLEEATGWGLSLKPIERMLKRVYSSL
jgi:glycosyltransferase involved in cell wall biosynthesis